MFLIVQSLISILSPRNVHEGGHEVHQTYVQPEGDLIFLLQHVIAKLVQLLEGLQVLLTHLSPGSVLT